MALFGSGPDHSAQLARIERKLDTLLASLGLGPGGGGTGVPDDPRMAEVRSLALGGQKIEAIKVYREITGLGLKESKEAVDALARG